MVVVQDLATRFPCAKVVSSTGGDQVIPAIEEVYDNYGNPEVHRTDNGPPFNSKRFEVFSDSRGVKHNKVFPYHPQANPVETFMKPPGKAMKSSHQLKQNRQHALDNLLTAY